MSDNSNQPAFPTDVVSRGYNGEAIDISSTASVGLTKRELIAAMANIDLEGWLATTIESIMGKSIPDFKVDPMANVKYMAEFKAILKLAEADALLNQLNQSK